MTKKYVELDKINEIINEIYSATEDINILKVLYQLENIPSDFIAEISYGKWQDKNQGRWLFCPMCSECEEAFYEMPVNLEGKVIHNYCPNCGAKLEL